MKASHIPDWKVSEGLVLHFPLDGDLRETTGVYERRNSFNHHTKLTSKYQGRHFRLTDVHGEIVEPLIV